MKKLFARLPGWVRWGLVPVLALLLFGSLIMNVLGFLIYLLFKVLIFVAFAALVIFLVKQLKSRK